jgi:hypothetical protein
MFLSEISYDDLTPAIQFISVKQYNNNIQYSYNITYNLLNINRDEKHTTIRSGLPAAGCKTAYINLTMK